MKNLRRLACKFDLDQSERKSSQVHARPGQTESQGDTAFQLASTCDSVWPGLKILHMASIFSSDDFHRYVSLQSLKEPHY